MCSTLRWNEKKRSDISAEKRRRIRSRVRIGYMNTRRDQNWVWLNGTCNEKYKVSRALLHVLAMDHCNFRWEEEITEKKIENSFPGKRMWFLWFTCDCDLFFLLCDPTNEREWTRATGTREFFPGLKKWLFTHTYICIYKSEHNLCVRSTVMNILIDYKRRVIIITIIIIIIITE